MYGGVLLRKQRPAVRLEASTLVLRDCAHALGWSDRIGTLLHKQCMSMHMQGVGSVPRLNVCEPLCRRAVDWQPLHPFVRRF